MITVLGSINIDLTFALEALPSLGETVLTPSAISALGGKGANQAVAAARAGAAVRFIGCVGPDAFGERARRELADEGVDVAQLVSVAYPTGLASIFVDSKGANMIAVASGANGLVCQDMLADGLLQAGDILVLQMEIPPDAVAAAIGRARQVGAKVVLNLAPARPLAASALRQADVLVLNEIEAHTAIHLLRPDAAPSELDSIEQACAIAGETGKGVVITLGGAGAVLAQDDHVWRLAALAVTPRDTTGAGDCFVGNLAAALGDGLALPEAVQRGVVGGSLACLGLGAQASYPRIGELKTWLTEGVAPAIEVLRP